MKDGWNHSVNSQIFFLYFSIVRKCCQVPVAHTCNPSYSGGRDQEDHNMKPTQANSSGDLSSKKTLHKKGLVEWLKV
jgi:hypothetical protein